MHLERIQTRPWVPVEQTQRFVKRMDLSALRKVFPYLISVFFREQVVKRSFVCHHLELPVVARLSFTEKRDRAAFRSDFKYGCQHQDKTGPKSSVCGEPSPESLIGEDAVETLYEVL